MITTSSKGDFLKNFSAHSFKNIVAFSKIWFYNMKTQDCKSMNVTNKLN